MESLDRIQVGSPHAPGAYQPEPETVVPCRRLTWPVVHHCPLSE